MSQRAVESVIGRLITDVDFRVRFFAQPARTCSADSLTLTPRELSAVLRLDVGRLSELTINLDPVIVRAVSLIATEDTAPARSTRLQASNSARMGGRKS